MSIGRASSARRPWPADRNPPPVGDACGDHPPRSRPLRRGARHGRSSDGFRRDGVDAVRPEADVRTRIPRTFRFGSPPRLPRCDATSGTLGPTQKLPARVRAAGPHLRRSRAGRTRASSPPDGLMTEEKRRDRVEAPVSTDTSARWPGVQDASVSLRDRAPSPMDFRSTLRPIGFHRPMNGCSSRPIPWMRRRPSTAAMQMHSPSASTTGR